MVVVARERVGGVELAMRYNEEQARERQAGVTRQMVVR